MYAYTVCKIYSLGESLLFGFDLNHIYSVNRYALVRLADGKLYWKCDFTTPLYGCYSQCYSWIMENNGMFLGYRCHYFYPDRFIVANQNDPWDHRLSFYCKLLHKAKMSWRWI